MTCIPELSYHSAHAIDVQNDLSTDQPRAIQPFIYQALPQRVIFGPGRLAEAGNAVRGMGCGRALILSTAGRLQPAERLRTGLGDLAAGVFFGAAMHTPVEITEEAVRRYSDLGADCVIALGGGSTTGLAKAIALRTDAPQLIIPTTYAGSEVTPILGETVGGAKKTQRTMKVLPEVVIYDVDLTLTLPPRISAASGMNAMAHAVEALYAPDCNPIVCMMAQEGVRALSASLPRIVRQPGDDEARKLAQYGGWLCGMCLAATTMALHHKLCHVIGGAFALPHAETHAILLPHVAAYNFAAAGDAMRPISEALGAAEAATGLYDLARSLDLPLSLRDIGMPGGGIGQTVDLAMREPYWNPRPLDSEALTDLLERAYRGEPPLSAIR